MNMSDHAARTIDALLDRLEAEAKEKVISHNNITALSKAAADIVPLACLRAARGAEW